jgi:hypothetical protein
MQCGRAGSSVVDFCSGGFVFTTNSAEDLYRTIIRDHFGAAADCLLTGLSPPFDERKKCAFGAGPKA